jgi:hypothetical protein
VIFTCFGDMMRVPGSRGSLLEAKAAGDLGEHEGWLLLAWRFYTNGVGVLLGVWLAARIYGWPALRHLVKRSTAEPSEAAGG